MEPVLVTCYVNPDIDGTACAVAYAEFLQKSGKQAIAGIIGEPHVEARYIFDRFNFIYPKTLPDVSGYDKVILVDASDLNGLEGKVPPEKVIEIIDHRKVNDSELFPHASIQIELVGAAATLIAEKFLGAGLGISIQSATLLYTAIVSNTFHFKASVTTERDIMAANWLNAICRLPDDFWRDQFKAKSDLSGAKLEQQIRGDFSWYVLGQKRVGIAQIEMLGAEELLKGRISEVVDILTILKQERGLDYIFQNTIELEDVRNYIVAKDVDTKRLLEKVFKISFNGMVAKPAQIIMRKQIVTSLKQELEH